MTSPNELAQESFFFRPAQECDIDGFLELVRIENWFMLDRTKLDIVFREKIAFLYAIVDKNNDDKVLGIGNVCKTRGDEAVLGNIIVRREFRGQGLGIYLLRKIMSLHDDLILTWFSTADNLYLKLGCRRVEQSGFSVRILVHREKVKAFVKENLLEETVQIAFFTEDRLDDLVRYDAEARGYETRRVLSMVTRTSDKTAIAVKGTDQRIVGYVAICSEAAGTLFFNGFYADDNRIAAALLRTALDAFPSQDDVRYYTLDSCQFLLQFGEPSRQSKQPRFSTGRIPVRIPDDKLYCLTEADLSY